MNAIEKSIIDGLNGVTSRKGIWKLFSSRYVSSTMELKTEKDKALYSAISEFLSDKDTTITTLPIKKFKSMFIDFSNDKLIESIGKIVTEKDIEKALKFYFKENHLKLNRYFCLAMNSKDKDNVYIVSVCRESGIYKFRESELTSGNESENEEDTSDIKKMGLDSSNSDMVKIAGHITDIARLSKDFNKADKIDIIKALEKMLEVNATVNVSKKSNKKSA